MRRRFPFTSVAVAAVFLACGERPSQRVSRGTPQRAWNMPTAPLVASAKA
jgi:hypothetical protein